MKNDIIHVACGLNDHYLMPYGVMLVSLFETNKTNKFHIHVFSGEFSDRSIETLRNITQKYNAGFSFYPLDPSLFNNLAVSERISSVTYYRDLIPEAINPEVEKIAYLDGDMIVLGDIRPLWEIDLEGYTIAAADDIAAIKFKEYDRLNIPEKFGYFNSGTILINRKEWIKNDISRKIFSYTRENIEILKYLDQDAENFTLCDKRKTLEQKWNQQVGIYFLRQKFLDSFFSQEQVKEIKKKPVIVHFNGMEKPWEYVNLHPYKKEFQYFLKISGFKKPEGKFIFRKLVKKIVYRILGWSWWNRI